MRNPNDEISASPRLDLLICALAENLALRGSSAEPLRTALAGALSVESASELFARAPRLIGKAPAQFLSVDVARIGMPVASFSADLLARVVVVAQLARQLDVSAFDTWLDDAYRHGEARERVAVLRALSLLPDPGRHEALAADACRANVLTVFEAIACDNPYPARHFTQLTFRQMALKAVFVELPIARIMGLSARLDAELARMATDYVSERRAAGRVVPEDAAWLAAQGDRP